MSVDLPPLIQLRQRLLPHSPRITDLAQWVRAVHDIPMPKGRGLIFGTLFPAFWHFGPTKPYRGAYTLLEFG